MILDLTFVAARGATVWDDALDNVHLLLAAHCNSGVSWCCLCESIALSGRCFKHRESKAWCDLISRKYTPLMATVVTYKWPLYFWKICLGSVYTIGMRLKVFFWSFLINIEGTMMALHVMTGFHVLLLTGMCCVGARSKPAPPSWSSGTCAQHVRNMCIRAVHCPLYHFPWLESARPFSYICLKPRSLCSWICHKT